MADASAGPDRSLRGSRLRGRACRAGRARRARTGRAAAAETCLEAASRTTGIGQYWVAKLLELLTSQRRLHILQIGDNLERLPWNYNDRWFSHRADNGLPVAPDFIIPDQLDQAALRRRFGDPSRIMPCGNTPIWLYDTRLRWP